MDDISFVNLFLVSAAALASPLLLGLLPRLRVPDAVLEIVFGILIGPAVLGWVQADAPVAILSQLGLAFLLFLAGLEIDFERLRGRTARVALVAFVFSIVLALVSSLVLAAAGVVETALIVAVILVATALGLVLPVLRDAGEHHTNFGQLALAGGSIGEVGSLVLLSLLFSTHPDTGTAARVLLLVGVGVMTLLLAVVLTRAGRSVRAEEILGRYAETSAQVRVRGAMFLLLGFVALVGAMGQEVILGAFIAGAVLRLVDRDLETRDPQTLVKLEGLGFGFLIPVFFVTTGLSFDGEALTDPGILVRVPVFLAILLVVRGVPAVLYRRLVGGRRAAAAGLLQATSLTFIVAATSIGQSLGRLSSGTAAALITAGILSVLIFPQAALALLGKPDVVEPMDTE